MLKVMSDTPSIRSIAVIGSGLAGLTCAILLGQSGHHVSVFEKSRGPGGRMASKRLAEGSADIGAQYFTARNPEFLTFLRDHAGVDSFQEWTAKFGFQGPGQTWQSFPDEPRYVGVPRMTAITRGLSEKVSLQAQVRIARLNRVGAQWQLLCTDGVDRGVFDQVIITAPPAQAEELLLESGLTSLADHVKGPVGEILPCWAVAAHFNEAPFTEFEAMRPDSKALYWVANNSSKPGRNDSGQWWVLHATPEWTAAHVDASSDDVSEQLLAEFAAMSGHSGAAADQAIAHRWLYARSVSEGLPGYLFDAKAGVGIAGDWLAGGRVEGAWDSASRLAEAMLAG